MTDLRSLPSVDALAGRLEAPHRLAVAAARAVIAEQRAALRDGAEPAADLEARARVWLDRAQRPSLRRVLNATGVLLHTNLGRAPLAAAARDAVARAAEGYANLELDLDGGGRGSRHDHVAGLLRELTGAEAALAVNNGAGAVLLAAAAHGGEIVVSRGQLVEIGGGFRIPEVVAQAGATLVEVGTTNRTRIADYEAALSPRTGAILRAHPSNFRQLGFVEAVEVEALCALGVPVIDDVGSGALGVLHDEPPVRRSVAAGVALTAFSGDKLLGGPQAGLLVGTRAAVAAARRHPLARALRIDKLSLAALEATLRLYRDPELARREIPVLRMLDDDPGPRAERLAAATGGEIVASAAKVGGGTLPLLELPGPAVAVGAGVAPDELAARLRAGDPPVIARIEDGRLLLDPRTLTDAEAELAAAALRDVLGRLA
ncbi:MAG: L-seryl-tRNA(Ser) seleniumtransferase [Solirubrobacteraceae bacterium]|nr:L-seryl-tRNA(Ser) seleniumtransferase [Solirubrobacteraceae bacterium]